jgi:hypothetical protein
MVENTDNTIKEECLAEKRRVAMILHQDQFVLMSQMYLSTIPMAGAAAFVLKDGQEGILINWDYYTRTLGEDFSDCIDFEIEHEAQELWLIRGKTEVDHLGPDHYAAIREAMKMAHEQGKLDRYMKLKRVQFKMFHALGVVNAMDELDFYEQFAEELRG